MVTSRQAQLRNMTDTDWFILKDFKIMALGKLGGAPKAQFIENTGYRWYSRNKTAPRRLQEAIPN